MPTYDYECDACGSAWELFQKITDDPIKKCPNCRKQKARRLFGTGAALMFKGSGFYETDYRSESYKKSSKADKQSSDSGGDSSKSSEPAAAPKKAETNKSKTPPPASDK